MLGGHIDVLVAAPANSLPHIESGRARRSALPGSSAETRKHLDHEYEVMTKIMVDLGVVTK